MSVHAEAESVRRVVRRVMLIVGGDGRGICQGTARKGERFEYATMRRPLWSGVVLNRDLD